MELLKHFVDLFLHLDVHLSELIAAYGAWTYGILFLIIFCETGLVVTPFLPGDSLLFAAGTFGGMGSLNPGFLFLLLLAPRSWVIPPTTGSDGLSGRGPSAAIFVSSSRSIWTRQGHSTTGMGGRRSFSPAFCPSFEPSLHSWPG
jgi:hypothetical protein